MERQFQPRCAICGTPQQLLRCAKCKTIYYCSIAHQHVDWPRHKQECRLLAKQKSNQKLQQLQNTVSAATLNNILPTPADSSHLTTNCDDILVESGVGIQPNLSVIWGTNENEIMNSQAETVSQNVNNEYHGNVEANSTTMEQMQFRDSGGGGGGGGLGDSCETTTLYSNNVSLLPQYNYYQQQQFTHLTNHNSQIERSSSYEIGHGDENVIENANERRYEDLCRNIINDMNQYGLSVVDDFLGMEKGLQILNEVHHMYAAGVFQDGQLVNNSKAEQTLRTIRGDKIAWVKGVEPDCSNVGYLINQIDAVICRANTMKNNGKLGEYNIKERTKAMVACYPGSGSHYVMHVDNPNKDGRVITAIYYLNVNWDTKRSGGVLRIFPEHGNSVADIEPKFDRLIFFWSDKRNPHEVQPAHRTRYAITVWYFDANEREAALNRCKYTNNLQQTTAATTQTSSTAHSNSNPNSNSSQICT